jgi:hypothetical protein
MGVSTQISAAIFSEFLKCPTKAHLSAIGEPAPGTFFVDIEARISYLYKAMAKRQLPELKSPNFSSSDSCGAVSTTPPLLITSTAIQSSMTLHCRDKSGVSEKKFYKRLIVKADDRFDAHLARLKQKERK